MTPATAAEDRCNPRSKTSYLPFNFLQSSQAGEIDLSSLTAKEISRKLGNRYSIWDVSSDFTGPMEINHMVISVASEAEYDSELTFSIGAKGLSFCDQAHVRAVKHHYLEVLQSRHPTAYRVSTALCGGRVDYIRWLFPVWVKGRIKRLIRSTQVLSRSLPSGMVVFENGFSGQETVSLTEQHPCFVLDGNACVILNNHRAEALIDTARVTTNSTGRLYPDQIQGDEIKRELGKLIAGDSDRRWFKLVTVVGETLECSLRSIENRGSPGPLRDAAAMLFVHSRQIAPQIDHQALVSLYQLTAKEVVVVEHLVSGRKTDEISRLMNIQMATTRSHIHSALEKSDTRTQQELICLVLGGLANA